MSDSTSNGTRSQQSDGTVLDVDIERQAKENTIVPTDKEDPNRPYQQLFGWLRRLKANGVRESLSSKTSTTLGVDVSEATVLRTKAIELLFGLSADCASEWPGILTFCSHLESCFENLLNPQFEIVWKILHRATPSTSVDCWHWCFAVIESFECLEERDASMEDAYDMLLENWKMSIDEKSKDKQQVLRAMFAVLCWTSATLKPIFDDEAIAAAIKTTQRGMVERPSVAANNSSKIYFSASLQRPLSSIFHRFQSPREELDDSGHHLTSVGTQSNAGSSNGVLYQSSLNYYSLSTIGGVRLDWVETLGEHLAFDPSTSTLSVFGFPSFCAINALRNTDIEVLKSLTAEVLPPYHHTKESMLYSEVLLSYRLLFGQSAKSRKLVSQSLSRTSKKAPRTYSKYFKAKYHLSSPASSMIITDNTDPFLSTICTTPLPSRSRYFSSKGRKRFSSLLPGSIFPSSVVDLDGELQESEAYTTRHDFPIFGHRLLILQNYNLSQQPSRVRDLWRDRRKPLQWYTFWAVLLIGGVTIVLGVLQLAVSIVQAYFTVHP